VPNEEEELAVDDLRPPSFSAVADRSDWLILLLLDVGGVVSGVSTTFGICKINLNYFIYFLGTFTYYLYAEF
jgi:hypothetical protein